MFKKTCSRCGKNSYSATDRGKWLCPYCNQDLTDVKAGPVRDKAGETDRVTGSDGRADQKGKSKSNLLFFKDK